MLCLVLHAARSDRNPPARLIDFAVHVLSFPLLAPRILGIYKWAGDDPEYRYGPCAEYEAFYEREIL